MNNAYKRMIIEKIRKIERYCIRYRERTSSFGEYRRALQGTSDNVKNKSCENVENYISICPWKNAKLVRLAYLMAVQFV